MCAASKYLFGFIVVLAMIAPHLSPAQNPRSAGFSLYTHAFLDAERRSSIMVNVTVPYTSLIFLKRGAAFQSDFTVYIKILNKKKKLVQTAVINEQIVVAEYTATRSAKTSSRSSKRLQLEPGDYIVRCVVQVKNTNRVFQKEARVTVPEFLEAGIGIGKPRLFAAAIDTSRYAPVFIRARSDEALGHEEKEGTIFAELDRHPAFMFDVYTEVETEDSVDCLLFFKVVDGQDAPYAYGKKKVRISGLRNGFIVPLNVDDWDPGLYVFTAKAVQENPLRETTSSFTFMLGYSRSMLTTHLDETIDILSLIADGGELAELRAAKGEDERLRAWAKFWVRRDPSPGTDRNEALEEHLRRVQHATENFSESELGWKTDRGRVYIKHGEPDQTELKVDTEAQGEYLLWYYYEQNLTIVFFDRFGLGDYHLIDSSQL